MELEELAESELPLDACLEADDPVEAEPAWVDAYEI